MSCLILSKVPLSALQLVIPGLSGSIFAVVVGLYDRLLNGLITLRQSAQNLRFLTPVGLGAPSGDPFVY